MNEIEAMSREQVVMNVIDRVVNGSWSKQQAYTVLMVACHMRREDALLAIGEPVENVMAERERRDAAEAAAIARLNAEAKQKADPPEPKSAA